MSAMWRSNLRFTTPYLSLHHFIPRSTSLPAHSSSFLSSNGTRNLVFVRGDARGNADQRGDLARRVRAGALSSEDSPIPQSWIDIITSSRDPQTQRLAQFLDFDDLMGLSKELSKNVENPFPLIKAVHPTKLVLVRNGEFYEAVGVDAVMMVQFTNLLPSGHTVPRIRCSKDHLKHILHRLTRQCGFEVVICEESMKQNTIGRRKISKQHYIAAIVGGAHQSYYFNIEDGESILDFPEEMESLPLAAVSCSQIGYSLIQYYTERNALKVTSRLSEEGLWSKLHSTGMISPLYLHASSVPGARIDSTYQQWEQQAKQIATTVFGSAEKYEAQDPVEGFLQLLNRQNPELQLDAMERIVEDLKDRTSPPPQSTVMEIGIHPRKESGVLPLMEFVLPSNTTETLKSWMKQCLLDPPPPDVVDSIQTALKELAEIECSIPKAYLQQSPNRIVQMCHEDKLDVKFIDELRNLLIDIKKFFTDPGVSEELANSLLTIAQHERNIELSSTDFLSTCASSINDISKVMMEGISIINNSQRDQEDWMDTVPELQMLFNFARGPEYYFIKPNIVSKEVKEVKSAEQGLISAVEKLIQETKSLGIYKSMDVNAEVSLLRVIVKKGSILPLSILIPDRSKPNHITNLAVEDGLKNFWFAHDDWRRKVSKEIKKLQQKLNEKLYGLVTASHISIIVAALASHVEEATSRQWQLPDISRLTSKIDGAVEIEGFWPYWMKKSDSQSNSITLDGMVVLTGPNMAGKSTILRSLAAVCCLASCGFYIPADNASIPLLDCVNLKTLIMDSPLENLSAFGNEMKEMNHVLNDATHRTLVLIDELGKGTEVTGGTALSAALLKELCQRKCLGVFATHLHKVVELAKDFRGVKFQKMEIDQNTEGVMYPTWRMVPGFTEESLGLDVALKQGIPLSIVKRASELMRSLDDHDFKLNKLETTILD